LDYELFRKEGLMKYANWLLITWFAAEFTGFIEIKGSLKGHESWLLIGGLFVTFWALHRKKRPPKRLPPEVLPHEVDRD
jgi:hypothetical protein